MTTKKLVQWLFFGFFPVIFGIFRPVVALEVGDNDAFSYTQLTQQTESLLSIAPKAKYSCYAKCQLSGSDPICTGYVNGAYATGTNQDEVCKQAKQNVDVNVPRGCYKRHCRCIFK